MSYLILLKYYFKPTLLLGCFVIYDRKDVLIIFGWINAF